MQSVLNETQLNYCKEMIWIVFLTVALVENSVALRYIKVANKNSFPIWIETLTNPDSSGPPLQKVIRVNPGAVQQYNIQDVGWAGRLWPKIGCNNQGNNCVFGQSQPPCPSGGCHPPADTKVEFFFPAINSPKQAYYDISLVDGYSMAGKITPERNGRSVQTGSCIKTTCELHLNTCPRNEKSGLGNLAFKDKNGQAVACLAPCKKWNYPAPVGLGRDEQQGDGRLLCCPHPVTVEECRRGIIVQTEYVKLLRRSCPSAYSYSYDDLGGLHNCPSNTSFSVEFYA